MVQLLESRGSPVSGFHGPVLEQELRGLALARDLGHVRLAPDPAGRRSALGDRGAADCGAGGASRLRVGGRAFGPALEQVRSRDASGAVADVRTPAAAADL